MKPIVLILFFFAACGAALPGIADEIKVDGIEILAYGEFKATSLTTKDAENTSLGKMTVLKDIELVKQSNIIDADTGTQFGVKYFVKGSPKGTNVALSVRLLHPATSNPDRKNSSTSETWVANAKVGSANYSGWIFEYAWELVPGDWTLQLYYKDQKMLEKKFLVRRK